VSDLPPPTVRSLNAWLALVTGLLLRLTEAGLVFVGFLVLVYILLGAEAGPYVGSVIANLSALVAAVTPQALVGVAIVAAVVLVLRRR